MTDTTTSTRSVADMQQHRRARVASHLRTLADRIEHSGEVDVVRFNFDREIETVDQLDGDEWETKRAQRGQIDDETFIVELQLHPYCPCGKHETDENGTRHSWAVKGDGHVCDVDDEEDDD